MIVQYSRNSRMKQADPLCGLLVAGNVNPSEVMLCPIEQAMTQRNLLLLVFATTVPIVGIVAGAVFAPYAFSFSFLFKHFIVLR